MTTDIERSPKYVNPTSGEVLTLGSSDNELGRLIDDLRQYKRVIDGAIKEISAELLARMDQQARWTVNAGEGVKLTGSSPRPEEQFDGAALWDALGPLIEAGRLAPEARHATITTSIIYKVNKAGVNALRALGGDVRAAVDSCAVEVDKDRRVAVSRS